MKFKKIIASLLIAAISLSFLPSKVFAGSAVTANQANIRKSAGIAYDVIATLQKGTAVEVLGKEMSWYKVKSGNVIGYTTEDLITGLSQEELNKYNIVKPNYQLLASYTTRFSTGDKNRNHNIELGAYKNSVIVKPKEVFSFNKNTGNSTRKDLGWREAGVIVNKEREVGIGGGICQTSSTTYSVVKKVSGLKVVERRPHSIPVGYVPVENEAMVNYGTSDFKFRNDNNYSIFVGAKINHITGSLTMSIYKINPEAPVPKPEPEKPKPDNNVVAKDYFVKYLKHLIEKPESLAETLKLNKDGVTDEAFGIIYTIDDINKDGVIDLLIDATISYTIGDETKLYGYAYICEYKDGKFKLSSNFATLNTAGEKIGEVGYYRNLEKNTKSWFYINYLDNTAAELDKNLSLKDAKDIWIFEEEYKKVATNAQSLIADSVSRYESSNVFIPTPTPNVILNGDYLSYNVPPRNIDSRVYIEMRSLFEKLGYEVMYDETSKSTVIKNGETTFVLDKGYQSKIITKIQNDEVDHINLDIPIKLVDNRTMFPLRLAGELLGYEVSWDGDSYSAILKDLNAKLDVSTPTNTEIEDTSLDSIKPEGEFSYSPLPDNEVPEE